MAYADEGAGPVMLLLHGWATHNGFFKDLSAQLARTNRVLSPTFRGHPGSEQGSAPLTIETLAEDIAEFCAALELKDVAALGWSMGAMALWRAAPKLDGRLSAIIVEEMGPRLANDASWAFGLSGGYGADDVADTVAEIRAGWPAYVARFARRMFARDASAKLIDWTQAEMSAAEPGAMAAFWSSMAAQDCRAALTKISAPMLVIHGADSVIYPDGATEFVANAAPKGQRIVLSGAGHVPHLETPDAFFEIVEAFARASRRPDLSRGGTP
ncbi:alpha/beta fold hydrolase [Terricaulis sp.]|uniref:alpha/beta fold hydrolase n=1 Tax=Terricaulis sp. TaxID=2768686 RepID=UPI0037848532